MFLRAGGGLETKRGARKRGGLHVLFTISFGKLARNIILSICLGGATVSSKQEPPTPSKSKQENQRLPRAGVESSLKRSALHHLEQFPLALEDIGHPSGCL